jgi:Protein of unknown function (DUF3168)
MSIETDFRALLAGYAPLASLVGARIALNAVPEESPTPLVVFAATHDRILGLDNTLLADQCSLDVQCWAETATEAESVANAVIAAIGTAPADTGAVCIGRSTTFDPEMGLDAVVLSVEWWA